MAELTQTLNQLLEGQTNQVSRRIGADEPQTRAAMQAAIPSLLAALGQQAERDPGLRQAVQEDHDGAIIDQLPAYLEGSAQLSPRTTNGAGILDHVLGDRQGDMQQALSAKTGLDAGTIGQLLMLLAPIVMGMLGKKGQASGNGGFNFDDIGNMLNREKHDARTTNPDIGDILDSISGRGSGGTAGGGIDDVLDRLGRKG